MFLSTDFQEVIERKLWITFPLLKATQALNDYKPFLGEGILRKILKNTYFEHILVDRPEEKEEHESFFMEQVGKFQDWIKGIKG